MVFQTAAVVIDDADRVLIVEDPVTGIMGLPRSYVPHCFDTLAAAPLAFLPSQVGRGSLAPHRVS